VLDAQVSRRDEQLPEQGFVYACFNTPERITQPLFSLWMTILCAQPDSVLWLRSAAPVAVHNLRASAAAQGVNPDRLVFGGFSPNRTQHLARHRLADLYLDTFPYNSHSTARDALQSGLPVLTLSGRSFASRVAASLLQALQLPQLIATNTQDYVDRAVALASAPVRVAELKAQLQQAIATTTLFDSKTLASHVETAYQHMLDRHRRGLPPQSFAVPASPQGY
jgi:predicted O-linked N-acetylglucosamine transferase (SPINDLY family)